MPNRERLIQLIYEGVRDDAAWSTALVEIADSVGAAAAGLGVQNMKTHEFWAVAQAGIDPALHDTYERLAPDNRIWQVISRAGRPMADQMVMPKPEFLRTALHAEYFVPQRFHSVMAAPVLADGNHSGVMVAFGSARRGDFEEADLANLADLAGHVSRALGLRLERVRIEDDLNARNHVLEDTDDGILMLDAELRVGHVNGLARRLLDQCDGLVLRHGKLGCREARDESDLLRAVRSALAAAAPGAWVTIQRRERQSLLARVTRLPDSGFGNLVAGSAVMLRVRDPEQDRTPTPVLLQRLFGVTHAEAKAMLAVVRTQDQVAAALQAGVARTTLRTQLRQAYRKLDLRDRTDLLRLLARYGFG